MLTLFSQERATELYGMEMMKKGEARGEARGIGIGRQEGIMDTYMLLVRDNLISKEVAANKLGISVSEFEKKLCAQA